MQSETTLVLFFCFILLIAVTILYVLYLLHINKFNESHVFYRNLLSVIKQNTKFNEIHKNLSSTEFDLNKLSKEQQNDILINNTILTNNSLSDSEYSNIIDQKLLDEKALFDKDPNNMFLKNSYEIYTSVYNEELSNLGLGTDKFEIDKANQVFNNYKDSYGRLKEIGDLFTGSGDELAINQLNIMCNLKVSGLSICDKDMDSCYDISVNDDKLTFKKQSGFNDVFKFGDDDLVVNSSSGVYHKNSFYKVSGDSNELYNLNNYIVRDYDSIVGLSAAAQSALYSEYPDGDKPPVLIKETTVQDEAGPHSFTYNSKYYYVYPYNKYLKPVIVHNGITYIINDVLVTSGAETTIPVVTTDKNDINIADTNNVYLLQGNNFKLTGTGSDISVTEPLKIKAVVA